MYVCMDCGFLWYVPGGEWMAWCGVVWYGMVWYVLSGEWRVEIKRKGRRKRKGGKGREREGKGRVHGTMMMDGWVDGWER